VSLCLCLLPRSCAARFCAGLQQQSGSGARSQPVHAAAGLGLPDHPRPVLRPRRHSCRSGAKVLIHPLLGSGRTSDNGCIGLRGETDAHAVLAQLHPSP